MNQKEQEVQGAILKEIKEKLIELMNDGQIRSWTPIRKFYWSTIGRLISSDAMKSRAFIDIKSDFVAFKSYDKCYSYISHLNVPMIVVDSDGIHHHHILQIVFSTWRFEFNYLKTYDCNTKWDIQYDNNYKHSLFMLMYNIDRLNKELRTKTIDELLAA